MFKIPSITKTLPLPELDAERSERARIYADVNDVIKSYSVAANEGFPTLQCGNIISLIARELNGYRFVVYPIVYEENSDHRKADYILIKLVNRRTVAVFELKLKVGTTLCNDDKNPLAQLFAEARLVCEREESYRDFICVYGNQDTWHIFVLDMTLPLEVKTYYQLLKGAVYSAHLLPTRNYFTSIDKETNTLSIYKTV